jgi:hypothetical protein
MVKLDQFNFMAFKLEAYFPNPPVIKPYHVPIYRTRALRDCENKPKFDLVYDSKIKFYIDGKSTIAQIA